MGAIRALVIYDPDRLSRNLGHQLLLAEEWDRVGVRLLFVTQKFEATPESWLFFQMRGALSEYERAKILERAQRGRIGRAKAGHVWGGNPSYGYRYTGGEHTGHWKVEEREADIVRQIFAWSAEGYPIREIARRLTAEGIPTALDPTELGAHRRRRASRKRGAYGVWAPSSVQEILSNSAYIGRAYHNKRHYLRPDHQRRQCTWREQEAWIELAVPAIVDTATFDAVQERLARNRQLAARRMKHPYLLRGRWFKCGRCGRSMTAMVSHGYRYFRCVSHYRNLGEPRCPGTIRAEVAEQKAWDAVMQVLSDPNVVRREVLRQHAASDLQQQDLRAERDVLTKALGRYDEQDRRMVRGYAEEILTLEDLQRYRMEVQPAIDALRRQLEELDTREAVLVTQLGQLDALISYCQHVRSTLQTFSLDERQLAFDALGLRVTYRQDEPLHIEVQLPVVSTTDAAA